MHAAHLKQFVLILLICFFSSPALADEDAVRKALAPHFPGAKIESLRKTPYLGLYEALVGGELFYTDEKAEYFFFGHIVDTKTRTSVTNERLQEIKAARRVPLDTLPLEFAIKIVKGNGERKLAVFTDPNCPYCKQLEKELLNITDVTIYTLLYPVLRGSMELSTSIWCAQDQIKAWDDFMLRGIKPKDKDCETPLPTLVRSGQENRVTGTPTLIFADGSIVGGMIPAEAIEERLQSAATADQQ
ncbi:thiol:disulfide interchange protein DsbC [Nitrosomonas marina]|uniref:Thiol:disulfide interchange protein n=1 Tax=Nitrosomonas marina TaxID=917 RepID=A0A1I0C5F2_9PROT|nr:DsbC family protein [Nitrosomonas marina]SET14590.1 thiol:disulfide interchange protein DsbC [Nitrosomonas marina]